MEINPIIKWLGKVAGSVIAWKVVWAAIKNTFGKVVVLSAWAVIAWKYAVEKYSEYMKEKELEEFREWKASKGRVNDTDKSISDKYFGEFNKIKSELLKTIDPVLSQLPSFPHGKNWKKPSVQELEAMIEQIRANHRAKHDWHPTDQELKDIANRVKKTFWTK